jgi:hypothetical protein
MTISNKQLHWFCALVTAFILTGCASRPAQGQVDPSRPYQGQVNQKGQPNGLGTMTYPGGGTYTGDWVDGKRHGRGRIRFDNGIIYEGQFSNDSVNGHGKATTPDGKTYEGEWVNFKTTGLGKTVFPDGATYVGSYLENKFHGQGTFTFPNGDKYVGEWRENNREGEGIFTFADGRAPMEGVWEGNKFVRAQRIPDHIAGRSPAPISEPNVTPDRASSSDVSQAAPRVLIPRVDAIKTKCAELGFKSGTEKFGDCVLKLSK